MRRLLLTLTAASALLLVGCTTGSTPPATTSPSKPSPSPTTRGTVRFTTARTTAVVAAPSAAERAIEASRALFLAAPGVVLASEGDASAQRAAAAAAVRLGLPMLLVPGASASPSRVSPSPAAAADLASGEAKRLGATWTVGFGAGARIAGLAARKPGTEGPPASPRSPLVVIAARPEADTAALATARAAGARIVPLTASSADLNGDAGAVRALAGAKEARAVLIGEAFANQGDLDWSVAAARTGWTYPGGAQRAFDGRSLRVALYGSPGDPVLGVLGQQDETATIARAKKLSRQYAALTDRTVSPMLEVITTVAASGPTDDGDFSSEPDAAELEPYVDRALAAGVPVILDLQPGRDDFRTQAKQYRSLLEKPGVGLALDPEWRLGPEQKPLVQIGRVSAAEVNRTSALLADLVEAEGLPPKPFVLHQFRLSMLPDRQRIVVDRPQLDTLIHVDGQGGQPDKQATWRALRASAPPVGWGWKNFLKMDRPVLSPKQTLQQVQPTPDLITYQ